MVFKTIALVRSAIPPPQILRPRGPVATMGFATADQTLQLVVSVGDDIGRDSGADTLALGAPNCRRS